MGDFTIAPELQTMGASSPSISETGRARRYGKQAPAGKVRETLRPVIVLGKRRQFMVVQSGALQAAVAKGKSYGVDEMQPGAGIGAKPHDVARICGNFGLVKNDIKHARF